MHQWSRVSEIALEVRRLLSSKHDFALATPCHATCFEQIMHISNASSMVRFVNSCILPRADTHARAGMQQLQTTKHIRNFVAHSSSRPSSERYFEWRVASQPTSGQASSAGARCGADRSQLPCPLLRCYTAASSPLHGTPPSPAGCTRHLFLRRCQSHPTATPAARERFGAGVVVKSKRPGGG